VEGHVKALRHLADVGQEAHRHGLHGVVIEAGSGPDDLLRQFRDRVVFDYLGHRFLSDEQEVQDERARRNGGGDRASSSHSDPVSTGDRSRVGELQDAATEAESERPESGEVESKEVEAGFRSVPRAWGTLVVGVAMVIAGVEGLLRVAIGLGDLLGTPSFLWGATVVAAATSVPDAIISLRSARRGDGDVSIGNVLGSNVFDLLVAIPAGVLIAGAAVVDYTVAAPLMAFLTLGTVVLFTALRTDLSLTRWEGWLLLSLYAVFVLWLALETADVTSLLGSGVG
ncbi:MAG: hypothetical protein R3253_12365, partial [Longimicrobiales bacterium]|nr:hypothetical protein [Longimicrobiales bacterium]